LEPKGCARTGLPGGGRKRATGLCRSGASPGSRRAREARGVCKRRRRDPPRPAPRVCRHTVATSVLTQPPRRGLACCCGRPVQVSLAPPHGLPAPVGPRARYRKAHGAGGRCRRRVGLRRVLRVWGDLCASGCITPSRGSSGASARLLARLCPRPPKLQPIQTMSVAPSACCIDAPQATETQNLRLRRAALEIALSAGRTGRS
jgi:hypothetical protein